MSSPKKQKRKPRYIHNSFIGRVKEFYIPGKPLSARDVLELIVKEDKLPTRDQFGLIQPLTTLHRNIYDKIVVNIQRLIKQRFLEFHCLHPHDERIVYYRMKDQCPGTDEIDDSTVDLLTNIEK